MLIILDGPDGAGKTTLATVLAHRIEQTAPNVIVRHCGPLKEPPLVEYIYDLDWYAPGIGANIIYDRHYIGELIYGPIYRGRSQINDQILARIESNLNTKGAVLVHVTGPFDVLAERNRINREDFLLEKDLPKVIEEYHNLVQASSIVHKITIGTPTEIDAHEILTMATIAENAAYQELRAEA